VNTVTPPSNNGKTEKNWGFGHDDTSVGHGMNRPRTPGVRGSLQQVMGRSVYDFAIVSG
jgi:hypothetical protein